MDENKSNKPMVSIIMPTYNRACFLRNTIQKILSQTYKNIELIIINDFSTDNTAQILEEISKKDSRIKIINNPVNLKIVGSLNKGIGIATGEYIARADDDDPWINLQKLENQINFLESNPNYVIVGTGAIVINEKGEELFRYLQPQTDIKIRNRMLFGNPFIHATVIFRKSVLEKIGLYDEDFIYTEDWHLWARIGKYGKMYNLPSYDIFRFYGERGISIKNRQTMSINRMRLIQKFKKNYPNFHSAYLFNKLQILYTKLPYLRKFNILLFKIKRKFLQN